LSATGSLGYAVRAVIIGSDEVSLDAERVFIHAARPMDWPIREFCRVPIWFEGQKYYLRSKHAGQSPRPVVYELWPWPADFHGASTREVVYDEDYVLKRDEAASDDRRNHRLYLALLPLYPLLGLLWSGFKGRVLCPLGFEPASITNASVFLIFNLFVVEAVFTGWLAGGLLTYFLGQPALRPVDWTILLLLGADSLMRFSQSFKSEIEGHWGFFEWLRPGRQ
jgi:hypothetical protein